MTETALKNTSDSKYESLRLQLIDHPIYSTLDNETALKIFMEHHVYAVWDFMSLVKSLQAQFAPSTVPWLPPENPAFARFINQLVLEEESDLALEKPFKQSYSSHFESYCLAMAEIGANRHHSDQFYRTGPSGKSGNCY